MIHTFRRVTLPVNESEPFSMPSPRGLSKGRMILWISVGTAVLSVSSVALGLYKWHEGEQALAKANTVKAEVEASKLQYDRMISEIDARYSEKLKTLELLVGQANVGLLKEQLRTQATEQEKNRREAELASARTTVEKVNGFFATEVSQPLVPILKESTACTMTRYSGQSCDSDVLLGPRLASSFSYPPAYSPQENLESGNPYRNPIRSGDGPTNPYKRSGSLPEDFYPRLRGAH